MIKRTTLIMIGLIVVGMPVFAGEKEELLKDIKIIELQKQNIELQMNFALPETYNKLDMNLKQAKIRLKELEDKEAQAKKLESPNKQEATP